ncbi:peptidylprolyl isomerase [Terrihabitans soli]|uniref:Parvulin-like PPIase n=1 Tax=Terrihabitans soli TaxID=708113 RepID=A0A6S6QPV5_9HYPH|nr:SurA N-terminal domain-containing protein [Terrihabitans soli]BCJ91049.1 peptidylprolyl isomerase [Terrihabitans soli]
MLTALRNKSAGIILKVIMGLIVLSFTLWGVEDVFRRGATNTLATVGDTDIHAQTFRDRFQRELQAAGSQFGRALTTPEARDLGLDRRVLADMMAEATLQEQARRMKLGMSDQAVADAIMKDQNFRGPNGAFDPNRFAQILRANNLNEPLYIALQKNLLLRRQLLDGVVGSIKAPDALVSAVFRHQNEKRTANYIVLPRSDGAGIAAPDEATLKNFYEERKGTFQAPERRSFALIAADPTALAAKETVTDEDVAKTYEEQKDKFGAPEQRTVERIPFPTPADAAAASAKIKSGVSFEDIAKEQKVSDADLSLGKVTKRGILDKAVADAAFSLAQGQVSDPVDGQFSTVILRVTAIEPESVKSLAEVKEALRADIAKQRAEDKIFSLHDQIEDDRAAGSTLAEIAPKYGLELKTFDGVDRQGRVGKDTVDVPGGPLTLSEVYQSDVGVENNPVQMVGGGYIWFDVTKVDPARERTYDEAKDDVLTRWRIEEARKQLDAKIDTALKDLRAGSLKLADLAARENAKVQTADKIDRRGGDLGASVGSQIFATAQGGFGSAPDTEDGRVVFEVTGIEVPAFDPQSLEAQNLAGRVAETVENDLASQYVLQLQNDLGSSINNQVLATALGISTDQQ